MKDRVELVSFALLSALVLSTPFEHRNTIDFFGLVDLSTVNVLLVTSWCLWGLRWAYYWTKGDRPNRLMMLGIIATGAPLITGFISITLVKNASVHEYIFFAEFILAYSVGWVTFDITRQRMYFDLLIKVIALVALCITVFACFDFLNIEPIESWLKTYHTIDNFAGIQRVSATLMHPNVMSIMLELTLPFVLVWMLSTENHRLRLVLGLILLGGIVAIVLSLSRGGTIAFMGAMLVYTLFALWKRRIAVVALNTALISALLLTVLVQMMSIPALQVRLSEDGSNDNWYRARYDFPENLSALPGESLTIEARITNVGLIIWEIEGNQPVNLGYHIICPDENMPRDFSPEQMFDLNYLLYGGMRTPLPEIVPVGEQTQLTVQFEAPTQPGMYWIAWDMIQEGVTWFSRKNTVPMITTLNVVGYVAEDTVQTHCTERLLNPETPQDPSRLDIWTTTLQIIRDNPLIGVGPLNFRSYYRDYSTLNVRTQHPHNMLLSLIVDFGLPTTFIMVGVFLFIMRALFKISVKPLETRDWLVWGAFVTALCAFAIHSIFDSFYSHTPTLIIMSVIIGMTVRFVDDRQS